jgi:hypothetical protein
MMARWFFDFAYFACVFVVQTGTAPAGGLNLLFSSRFISVRLCARSLTAQHLS